MTDSIGTAHMQPDGTMVLQLIARGGHGERGHATLTYPPQHPRYAAILDHVGGLQPGQEKPVPPFI